MALGRWARTAIRRGLPLLLVPAVLTGCMITPGAPTLDAELERLRSKGDFALVSSSPLEAVIAARGREVVVSPGEGSCIHEEAIDLGESSAFLLFTDCHIALGPSKGVPSANGQRLHLSPAFPGLVTVSVASERRGLIRDLEAFLQSADGRAQLARDAGGAVEILEMREVDDALYVHARTLNDDMPLLSADFWRAFAEINDRLVLVTVSGFRANAPGSEVMFEELARQVTALRAGNGQGASGTLVRRSVLPTPTQTREVEAEAAEIIATSADPSPDAEAATSAEALAQLTLEALESTVPNARPAAEGGAEGGGQAERVGTDRSMPLPPERRTATKSEAVTGPGAAGVEAGSAAPPRAPRAPPRRPRA
ncbi:MAG: hypothetical protein AAF675_05000 [Pseudomonadota bacterium]